MAVLSEYTWIFVLSIFTANICAFGIGANDLANAFGSSVGTKALKMWQAVALASVCEFGGALLLGAGVTSTIKGGIARTSTFADIPAVFMYGMFAVTVAAGLWDNLACHLELPVSTTHTTVGAVIGFALASEGGGAVIWHASRSDFPFYSGFTAVISSWIISPITSGVIVFISYGLLRTFALRRKNSFQICFYLLPCFVGIVLGTVVAFVIQTGNKNSTWDEVSDTTVIWISCCFAVGSALLSLVTVMPIVRRTALKDEARLQERIAAIQAHNAAANGAAKDVKEGLEGAVSVDLPEKQSTMDAAIADRTSGGKQHGHFSEVDASVLNKALMDVDLANEAEGDWTDKVAAKYHAWIADSKWGKAVFQNKLSKAIGHALFYDVHDAVRKDEHVAAVWAHAEVFDYKTERLFRYLQVFSAASMMFAHGSNDVANAMGPFSSVYTTWNTGKVPGSKGKVQMWILAMGGASMSIGLATFGYKIMRVLGVKSVKLTNVRGFIVEWATALTVVLASRYGLPVSTTQVCTGAILATGLMEGPKNGVNWRVMFKIFFGWVLTLFVACGVSAAVTAFGIYSPNKNADWDTYDATNALNQQTYDQIQVLNGTDAVSSSQIASWNSTLTSYYQPTRDLMGSTDLQTEVFGTYNSSVCFA